MKRVIAVAALAILLSGCGATTKPINPDFNYYEVPVASWPEPAIYKLTKTAGIEYIKEDTSDGDVAKHWEYEAKFWRNQADIFEAELDMYKHSNYNMKSLEQIIKEVNERGKKIKTSD